MRSMEEEVEVGGPRDDFLSEDDHSPTDASEDSVEVRVKPIRAPTRPPTPPPTAHPKFHKFRKHYSALRQKEYAAARASPPSPAAPPPRPPTPASPVETPVGAAPLSPGTRAAAAARSRRKPAEPRRLCHDPPTGTKRPLSPGPSPQPPRPTKLPRPDPPQDAADRSTPSSPSPGAPPLLAPHPLLGHLGRQPMGAFPPLLLPPAWPPVAAQWGYPRVVTPLGWAGLAPHPYPMLLPPHYPLPRHALHPHLHPASPPPRSPPEAPSPTEERTRRDDLPLPLVTRVAPPETPAPAPHHPRLQQQPGAGRGVEVSVVQRAGRAGAAGAKFLSVESLIGTTRGAPEAEDEASGGGSSSRDGGGGVASDVAAAAAVPGGEEDESLQALLQPGKHKQRNYKNMTRERRIEANARERNRVHTISAAFEKLRSSVPAYSHNQKLSKLSVLRIACSYILSLSRLAGHDYSDGGTQPSFSECVDLTTRTIQVEGKAKKKRDE